MAEQLRISTPGGEYPLFIQPGALAGIADWLDTLALHGRTATITDTTVDPLYGRALAAALPDTTLITMPQGEPNKTLATVADLYRQLVLAGMDRSSTVIALGGGVVGDTAGFAAATYMRGVRLVQIPTTLLAMVDSSVGGKVGVDLPEGKNLVGAFKQPDAVLIDPAALDTLPPRQLACGLAEVIKHGLLADPVLLDQVRILPTLAADHDARREALSMLIERAVRVKIAVVEADPYEHGIRAHLNLGHTFGHAVEQVSGYAWMHGEAVGVGLIAAARLSAHLGLCDPTLPGTVEGLVGGAGLPTRIGTLDVEALFAAMSTDKKWRAGKRRFVLLKGIGQPFIIDDTPPELVIAVLENLRGDAP